MPVVADFTTTGANLKWVGFSQLTELIPNTRYQTPDEYVPGTLLVMRRGLPISAENDDGYIEFGVDSFDLKEPLLGTPNDWIFVGYIAKT